jgi:diguanylate cyclase
MTLHAMSVPLHSAGPQNHKIRFWIFLLLFATVGLHMSATNVAGWAWVALALQFLLYPQLLSWRTQNGNDPDKTEWQHRLLDALLAGVWVAALAFPLWITYVIVAGAAFNLTALASWKGLCRATLAICLGALLTIAFNGLQWSPQTDLATTASSMLTASLLMLLIADAAHRRSVDIDVIRTHLGASEQTQRYQLGEIDLLQTKLNEQVNLDALTGLYNRRFFGPMLERELARCQRERQPLTLIMIDVDHLNRVNDCYGRRAGDDVLRSLSAMLKERTRAADVVCRYGGEEFLLLMPSMPPETALDVAEGWRTKFAATTVYSGDLSIRATVSLGVTTYVGLGESPQELIHRANLALTQAKSDGRDRVALFGGGDNIAFARSAS